MTVMVDRTAITHNTGAITLNKAPMMTKHQAFGALHEADPAGADQRFGAGASIADHDGADHDERGQNHIKKRPPRA